VDKIGNALGSALFLAFLAGIGFIESTDGGIAQQEESVLNWIAIAYVIVPALLHVSSVFILNRYELNPEELDSVTS